MALIDKFAGGPVGIDSLSAAVGEERDTPTSMSLFDSARLHHGTQEEGYDR